MPWVRLDDHFDEHPKLARVGPLGLALWVTGLAYCNRNLTDGFIPWATARKMMSWEFLGADDGNERGPRLYRIGMSCGMTGDDVTTPFVIDLLIDAGLWDEVTGGYQIHDYDQYQPTKEQVEADREKKANAGRAGGLARAQAHAKQVLEQTPSTRSSKTQAKSKPVPVPVPVPLFVSANAETRPAPLDAANGTPKTAHQGIFDVLVRRCGQPANALERGRFNKACKLFAEAGCSPAEADSLFAEAEARWGGIDITPLGVAGNVTTLRRPAPAAKANGRREGTLDQIRRLAGQEETT